MSASAIETSTPKSPRRMSRNTGFPEPFNSDRNTTLPHPDADTSPNACISQDDMNIDPIAKRSRRSFIHKHRRTVSHGVINPSSQAVLSVMSVLDTSVGGYGSPLGSPLSRSASSVRKSNDGSGSSRLSKKGDDVDEYTPPSSPETTQGSFRKSILRKWRRN